MDELIQVNYSREQPLVSARELHDGLEIKTKYSMWFERITELGFIEGQDFFPEMGQSIGGRPGMEHFISVDMAKQICMLQRTEKGKMYRQYFLELEKAWNSPEQVMARALQLANQTVEELKARCMFLGQQVESQKKTIAVIEPKAKYLDKILGSEEQLIVTQIAKDYGMSAQKFNKILSELQIQYREMNNGYSMQSIMTRDIHRAGRFRLYYPMDGCLRRNTRYGHRKAGCFFTIF